MRKQTTPKKFKRRPQGTGTYYKLSGNRRKPWIATVTVGYDTETGKQIQKPIGYFESDVEALNALSMYQLRKKNLLPMIDMDISKAKAPTFGNIWKIIEEKDISKLTKSAIYNYRTAFKALKVLHCMKIDDLTLVDIQPIFDEVMRLGSGESKLRNMKIICRYVFKYAMKYDYIKKDYSEYIEFSPTNEKQAPRKVFTNDEIKTLFNDDSYESKLILIYIFTGMRPTEFLKIRKCSVHLEDNYLVGGLKTKAGRDRIIPIHNAILPFVANLVKDKDDNQFLVYDYNSRRSYDLFTSEIFKPLMEKLNMIHTPYDTRHTFATIAKMNHVDDFARKRIMGHSSRDLTDDVYTASPIAYLISEINKISIWFC